MLSEWESIMFERLVIAQERAAELTAEILNYWKRDWDNKQEAFDLHKAREQRDKEQHETNMKLSQLDIDFAEMRNAKYREENKGL